MDSCTDKTQKREYKQLTINGITYASTCLCVNYISGISIQNRLSNQKGY